MDTLYQQRYVAHQARKKQQITENVGELLNDWEPLSQPLYAALERRRSQRLFSGLDIAPEALQRVLEAGSWAPSSCNRHGIGIKAVEGRDEKELLGGLLVGGVGWMHRAHTVFLLLADPVAYASPNEKAFMHYCDAGFLAMSMWLAAEAEGLGACYINPNIKHKDVFDEQFGKGRIFVGALCVGRYEKRVLPAERVPVNEILL